jgi:NAD(P)H-hydrate epimerase
MKILSAAQIRQADAHTLAEEQIPSAALMERAAKAFVTWFDNKFPEQGRRILVCCGPGNNGGDGLAIARLLLAKGYALNVWLVAEDDRLSPDCRLNLERLPAAVALTRVSADTSIPASIEADFIVDALFGTGLSRPVSGLFGAVIDKINDSPATRVAVDMPSGLFADAPNAADAPIVQAHYTLSFELPKLAFFLPQHHAFVGNWEVVPIGLSAAFLADAETNTLVISPELVGSILRPRQKFSHKGTYGHALLLAGSYGKMGAAVLASRACLRSGVGLLTVQCPQVGYDILQTGAPEAMALPDADAHHLTGLPPLEAYQAIGAGPGLGTAPATRQLIRDLLQVAAVPLVLDADALNLVAEEGLLPRLPPQTILTPHPKEFERLAGKAEHDYHRLDQLRRLCREHQCYIILKGGHTCIGTPEGTLYFNCTGNPGMATGGTGDVLTGIVTALAAQQYSPLEACLLGVYIHGRAGDIAKTEKGEMALIASDVIDNLGAAFVQVNPTKA